MHKIIIKKKEKRLFKYERRECSTLISGSDCKWPGLVLELNKPRLPVNRGSESTCYFSRANSGRVYRIPDFQTLCIIVLTC